MEVNIAPKGHFGFGSLASPPWRSTTWNSLQFECEAIRQLTPFPEQVSLFKEEMGATAPGRFSHQHANFAFSVQTQVLFQCPGRSRFFIWDFWKQHCIVIITAFRHILHVLLTLQDCFYRSRLSSWSKYLILYLKKEKKHQFPKIVSYFDIAY